MRHLPNLISLLRIALIWPILRTLVEGQYDLTLLLFFLAALSDGLDGFLAKRFHWTSELGKWLDPIGDKLLLMGVFLVATWHGMIPRWLTVIAVGRDVLIGAGALTFRLGWGPLNGRPMISSKLNTLLQLLYVLLLVCNRAFGFPSSGWIEALEPPMCITLLLSGFLYVREFTHRALVLAHA